MSYKGTEWGQPIKYLREPPKIEVKKRGRHCQCDNCAGHGEKLMTYTIYYSKTDYALPNGDIGDERYAKPRELWLCEECFNELKEAINNIGKESKND